MPCWELFEEQPAEYRDEVLPPDVKARLSVEPGVELGWSKWVGDGGDSISIEHFGASAPGRDGARGVRLQPRQRRRARDGAAGAGRMNEAETIKAFFSLVAPGFTLEGELPAVETRGDRGA